MPVWSGGTESRFPGMPYVVFPGKVGDANSLSKLAQKLGVPLIQSDNAFDAVANSANMVKILSAGTDGVLENSGAPVVVGGEQKQHKNKKKREKENRTRSCVATLVGVEYGTPGTV